MYLKNTWYVAAWSDEVSREMMSRTICEEHILLYRKENGDPVAIGNMCPHRFAPLNMGKLIGDDVQCPYHGMVFGESGKCVLNPHHGGQISPAMKVPSYSVVERHALIWIWMGEAEKADPAQIPDFSCHTDPAFVNVHGVIEMAANYELITDNLLDLTHGEFVHEGLLSSPAITVSKLESPEAGNTVWANRWMPDGEPAPVWNILMTLGKSTPDGANVDHWLYMRWDAPAHMLLDAGTTVPGGTREDGVWAYGTDIITPIDATHSYYFWAVSRNHDIERQDITEFWRSSIDGAFVGQDKPIIEAQQRMLGNRTIDDMRPVAIPADISGGKARRVLQRLIKADADGSGPKIGHRAIAGLVKDGAGTSNPVAPAV